MLIVYKQGCPWSKKALKEIKKRKIPYMKMVVTSHNGGEWCKSYTCVKKLIKHNTFPVIYSTQGRKIGGYDSLMKYFDKHKK